MGFGRGCIGEVRLGATVEAGSGSVGRGMTGLGAGWTGATVKVAVG